MLILKAIMTKVVGGRSVIAEKQINIIYDDSRC